MIENKMGTKPIPGLIITMSVPIIFSMLVQALYNVVDSIFVSRISEDAITAVSLAFPIQMIIVAAFVGLQTGMSSIISRRLGAKDKKGATIAAEHGLIIAAGLYVIVIVLSFFFKENYFGNFTQNQSIVSMSITYTTIVMLFSFGIISAHSASGMMQGTGDMVKPMVSQLIGAVTNIILDPIFIFGYFGLPAMGVKGAAIATVTGQILSMIYVWYMVLGGKTQLKLNLREFKYDGKTLTDILVVGIPSMIMQGLGSIMLVGMNLILSAFGDAAIAVMGIYFRIQSMVFMPIFGLAIGTMPVIGYNFGAKNKKRMSEAIRFSVMVASGFMIFCFIIFQLFPGMLMGMFNPSETMLAIGITAMRRISLVFIVAGATIILSTSFQAFGKAYYSLILSVIRQLVILLPSAYLLSRTGNVDNIWYAFGIAEIFGITAAVIMFSMTYYKATEGWSKLV